MKFNRKKNNSNSGKSERGKSRKELRKEKRNAKKKRRHDYYCRRSKCNTNISNSIQENCNNESKIVMPTKSKRNLRQDRPLPNRYSNNKKTNNLDKDKLKDIKNGMNSTGRSVKGGILKKPSSHDSFALRKMDLMVEHEKLQEQMRNTRKIKLGEQNEEEERLIKRLEKQLKLSRRKSNSVPKSFADDGLDYLLDVCNSEKLKQVAAAENVLFNSDSEFEDDLATAFAQKKEKDMECEESQPLVSSSSGSGTNTRIKNCSEYCKTKKSSMASATESESDSDFIDSELESESENSSVYDCGDSSGNDKYQDDEYYGSDEASYPDARGNNNDCKLKFESIGGQASGKTGDGAGSSLKALKGKRVHFGDGCDDSENELLFKKGKQTSKKIKLQSSDKRKSDIIDASPPKVKKIMVKKTKHDTDEPGRHVHPHSSALSVDSDEMSEGNISSSDTEGSVNTNNKSKVWEDIYGRLRDQDGNVITKQVPESGAYVPPALRAHHSRDDEQSQQRLQRLNRQVKGYFNRLTERNMASISTEMETLYNNNSRHDMNTTFTTVFLDSLVTKTISLERLIMEHSALVACMHSRIGSDVGAFVLQSVVKKFDALINDNLEVESKEIDNVVLIICYLYNFNVVHFQLIFDILRLLAGKFGPKEVELILIMLRTVGFGLRKDNPNDVKTLMLQLQEAARSSSVQCSESRVRFMLEVLLAVKNNNMTRIPGCNPGPVEHIRKFLRALLAKGNISPELNVSLQDLLQADERGRWWVVGSAWAGQGPVNPEIMERKQVNQTSYSAELLELARRQRMNTEDRRNIFCILMTANDYEEAFNNLMHLGLKGRQARDIVLVTLHCCLQERTFNMYYAHVIQNVCAHNRVYWVTLQFALWDKIKELKKLPQYHFSNLVQLMQYLLLQGIFTLIMFKVMDFTSLEQAGVRFLRKVLLGILNANWEECEQVFLSVAKVPSYKMFCTGLRIFLQQYVNSKISSEDTQQALLKQRIEQVDCLLGGSFL